MTVLCLASFEKGYDFLVQCKAQGNRVLLVTSEKLKDICNKLQCEAIPGDISKKEVAQNIYNLTYAKYNKCDVLINNAGIIESGAVEDIDIDKVCKMVRINVEANFRLTYL